MQQTILALGALMIITMISVNQQHSYYGVMENAYIREVENAAYDYSVMRMEAIVNSTAFDESVVGSSDPVDVGSLANPAQLGADIGESDLMDFDDLDDFHTFQEDVQHVLSADTFRFSVDYEVRYVNLSDLDAIQSSPTLAKELTIKVVSQDSIGTKVARFTGTKIAIGLNN